MGCVYNPLTGQFDLTGGSGGAGAITSVNGQTGIVVLDTDDISEGTAQYFTTERAQDATGAMVANSSKVSLTYVDGTPSLTADIIAGSLVNADINASAAIDATKIANGSVSNTEFQFLDGVTSSIQTQLNSITGSGITSLTGDVTGTGPGATATTLATVNGNVGSFGTATQVSTITINAKGLVTAASNTSIQITESQVTNLTTDLAAKQSTTLTSAHILVGNGSNVATDVAASGDLTLANTGAFTVAKIQGTTVSGTTGSTNVVFSSAPTLSNPIVGTQSQNDNTGKAASTAYVDLAVSNAVAGVNPSVAVQAATTAASDTSSFTYNNGVSGVGATLTGPVNTALTVDGYTFTALGQRLLVKNDTQSPSGAFNGVYYVTQVQTGILPLILTRALDYNQPSDINNTGAIPVINGTINADTSWLLTSQVTTVGTDPLTYRIFTTRVSNGDISELSFTGLVNNTANQTITSFVFSNGTVRAFTALVSVFIDATSDLFANFRVDGIQRSSDWVITTSSTGDIITGFTFDITSAGQMRASIGNISGFSTSKISFRAITTTV